MARYILILGTKNWSSWSLRAYLAMRATKVAFEEVLYALDRTHSQQQSEELRAFSPTAKVPVLKIEEDGGAVTVWDSLAICETLAERHPEAGLWPDHPHARARARAYAAEMHAGFADLREQLPMKFAQTLPPPALRPQTMAQIARVQAAWSEALNESGGPFLFGAYSIADISYAPVVSRFLGYGVALAPPLLAYCERMMLLPEMQDWRKAAETEIAAGLA